MRNFSSIADPEIRLLKPEIITGLPERAYAAKRRRNEDDDLFTKKDTAKRAAEKSITLCLLTKLTKDGTGFSGEFDSDRRTPGSMAFMISFILSIADVMLFLFSTSIVNFLRGKMISAEAISGKDCIFLSILMAQLAHPRCSRVKSFIIIIRAPCLYVLCE